jgi:hypothetical protein
MSANNVAGHIGREYKVTALGKEWTFSRWTRRVWVEFAAWAKKVLPDPITAALAAIEQATIRDAEIMRELTRKDAAEIAKAEKEQKPPVLMAGQYKPLSEILVNKAQELASSYLDFNSPQFRSILASPAGASYAMYLLLKPNHPDVTEDDAYDVMTALGGDEIGRIFATVQGKAAAADLPKNAESPAA